MKKTFSPCHAEPLYKHSRKPLRYRCSVCQRTYSARHGQLSFGSKLSPQEVLTILNFLKRGFGIRQTAELLNMSPTTIERWKKKFYAQKLLFTTHPTHYECLRS